MEAKRVKQVKFEVTSFVLHILAMVFMLCDHLWATVVPGNADWLTCIGRIAFPIFAFLTVEGFSYTKNLNRYMGRMLMFAVISELPFNLMMSGSWFYPLHQNVLWSFLISLGLLWLNEKAKAKGKLWLRIVTGVGTVLLGTLLGLITFVDYYSAGILTVILFYFFRGRKWWQLAGQFLGLAYINLELLGGLAYEISLFGNTIFFPQQAFALLALIPIWLYRGKQGPHGRALQLVYYAFYPVHLLILGLMMILL